jgi:hypothetical protein
MRTLVPSREAVNCPSYMVMTRISSPVWQAFGHTSDPERCASEHEMHGGCASEETDCGVVGLEERAFHSRPFPGSCRNIAITLIIRPGACPEGTSAPRQVNDCNRLLTSTILYGTTRCLGSILTVSGVSGKESCNED